MKPGFWSEPVRLWLIASGRQDLVDRGDALAQRVTALLVAVRQRADQYLSHDDLYSGRGGEQELASVRDTSSAAAAMAEIDEFVNVRLREEIASLESMLAVFEDLRSSPGFGESAPDVCDRLSSVKDENIVGFYAGVSPDGGGLVMVLTVTDTGLAPGGLTLAGLPVAFARAPRSLRRRIFASAT